MYTSVPAPAPAPCSCSSYSYSLLHTQVVPIPPPSAPPLDCPVCHGPADPTNAAAPCPPCRALATDALMLITDFWLTAADVAASPLVPPARPSQPAQDIQYICIYIYKVYIDNCSHMVICICTCRHYMISNYSVMYV